MFVLEGYNKKYYISGIVSWETLFVSNDVGKVENYIKTISEDYELRVSEKDEVFSEQLYNYHWDIYTGL